MDEGASDPFRTVRHNISGRGMETREEGRRGGRGGVSWSVDKFSHPRGDIWQVTKLEISRMGAACIQRERRRESNAFTVGVKTNTEDSVWITTSP